MPKQTVADVTERVATLKKRRTELPKDKPSHDPLARAVGKKLRRAQRKLKRLQTIAKKIAGKPKTDAKAEGAPAAPAAAAPAPAAPAEAKPAT